MVADHRHPRMTGHQAGFAYPSDIALPGRNRVGQPGQAGSITDRMSSTSATAKALYSSPIA